MSSVFRNSNNRLNVKLSLEKGKSWHAYKIKKESICAFAYNIIKDIKMLECA